MSAIVCHEVWAMDPPRDYPVLVHEFRGETREEARAAYEAHLAGDDLLRGCVERDVYAPPGRPAVRCTVRWWYDDDDARDERYARAWLEERRGGGRRTPAPVPPEAEVSVRSGHQTSLTSVAATGLDVEDDGAPSLGPRVFRPRVIEGGGGRPPGHEDHDPAVCDVRTG